MATGHFNDGIAHPERGSEEVRTRVPAMRAGSA